MCTAKVPQGYPDAYTMTTLHKSRNQLYSDYMHCTENVGRQDRNVTFVSHEVEPVSTGCEWLRRDFRAVGEAHFDARPSTASILATTKPAS